MQAIINKLQSAIHIAENPTLNDLLLSIRRDVSNKWLEQQAERRKTVKALKEITDNRIPEWLRGRLETMIKELDKDV